MLRRDAAEVTSLPRHETAFVALRRNRLNDNETAVVRCRVTDVERALD